MFQPIFIIVFDLYVNYFSINNLWTSILSNGPTLMGKKNKKNKKTWNPENQERLLLSPKVF